MSLLVVSVVPSPAIISNDPTAFSGGITLVLASTKVLCYAFELQSVTVILGGKWYMGATATGTSNMGIYTLLGNLIVGSDSGPITNLASQVNSYTYGAPISLQPGQYLMGLSCSNGTDTYLGKSLAANTSSVRSRLSTNVLSGNALPLTLGSLIPTSNIPACSLTVQGGL